MNQINNNEFASCFLSADEKSAITIARGNEGLFFSSLEKQVNSFSSTTGLVLLSDGTKWWYPVFETLSKAALLQVLQPSDSLASWIKTNTLSIARYSEEEWVGPPFRDHSKPLTGHLETAHVCWAIAAVLDLVPSIFSDEELDEISAALLEKGIIPCERWLQKNNHLANWRGIMLSGLLVPAIVLQQEERVNRYLPMMQQCFASFKQMDHTLNRHSMVITWHMH